MVNLEDSRLVKAINWPLMFRDEVIGEPVDRVFAALRPGRLYYDNRYWSDGEPVHIRVNHKIIRKASVEGDLKCCPIQSLTPEDYASLKSGLQSPEAVIQFLNRTYEDKPVTAESEVTVVYYRNEPIDPEILEVEDDLHMP